MIFRRPTIPLLLVFALGVLGFVLQYVPHPASNTIQDEINGWFKIIGGFAMFLGVYSLLHMHVTRIRRKLQGWGYSVFVFLGAAIMIAVGLYNGGAGPLAENAPKDSMDWFQWGYDNVLIPCQATIFSILAFFMASAAFRTFRARNVAAALLLTAAIVVMFGRVPISDSVGRWLFGPDNGGVFSTAADAVMEYPNMAAKRAIMMGISLGAISQSLRILFGIERSYLGGGD
jgi:hypothetical protein